MCLPIATPPVDIAEAAAVSLDSDPLLEGATYSILEEDEDKGIWRIDAFPNDADDARGIEARLKAHDGLTVIVEKLADAEWDEVYETNLRGPWVLAQAVIKCRLADQRECSIINIASILGIRAIGHLAPYSAAKAGLINLGRDLCVDLAARGIRVNALAPGYFFTEMNDEWLRSPAGDRLRQRVPAKRFGQAAELDGARVFLASDASRFMNGNLLTIDGGQTAGV